MESLAISGTPARHRSRSGEAGGREKMFRHSFYEQSLTIPAAQPQGFETTKREGICELVVESVR